MRKPYAPEIPVEEGISQSLLGMLGKIIRETPIMQLEEISFKLQFHMNSSSEGVLDSLMKSMENYIESLLHQEVRFWVLGFRILRLKT